MSHEVPVGLRGSVLAVLGVALAARLFALDAANDAELVLDEQGYLVRAAGLLEGHGFLGSYQSWVRHEGRPNALPQYPGAWQPPAQTAWLAAGLAVGGVPGARFAQVLLGVAAVALVYALGAAWFDRAAGLAAAWLAALYPNLVAFSTYLWSEPLFIALFLTALWLLTRTRALPNAHACIAAGCALGLAALTRSAALYFLPVLLIWLVWAHRRQAAAALRATALVGLAACLVVAPWVARNVALHGGPMLIDSNGPYNFWRGNGPDAFVGREALPHYAWPFESIPLAPVGNRTARRLVQETQAALGTERPTDLEIARFARDSALAEIRAEPGAFLARVPLRLIDMWNPTSFLLRHLQTGAYGAVPPAVELVVGATAVLGYLAVMGLGAIGCWAARRRSETWLVLAFAGFLTVVSAVAFGITRFRLPLMPLWMVLAGPLLVRAGGRRAAAGAAVALLALSGCGRPVPEGPNVLWVVWDTVRADHLGLYGYERETTPRLDAWAGGARVYEDALSSAGYTLPSHASMFTGLLPSEHCTHNDDHHLAERFTTIAEVLHEAGWRTYLFSANPHLNDEPNNFAQGFEQSEHPWDDRWKERAYDLTLSKLPPEDRSSELRKRIESASRGERGLTAWNIKAAGELAREALLGWLDESDARRPYFAFVNYMEAHRPTIPPRRYREHFMTEAEIDRSYRVDRSWLPTWEYTFGLRDYTDTEIALTRATYDATLRELDDLFGDLLDALRDRGDLDDTVVILTADHGEHLGEQHMLDHQYSLYQVLLHVPLVIHYPAAFAPGRETAPVTTRDLYPTLLELAGIEASAPARTRSLLAEATPRPRVAEDPAPSRVGIGAVVRAHPGWDPSPFLRRMRAYLDDGAKYIWQSTGPGELYDLQADAEESRNLILDQPGRAQQLAVRLEAHLAGVPGCSGSAPAPRMSEEQRRMLQDLGYVAEDAVDGDSR